MHSPTIEYRPFTINIPKMDVKRFKTIAKAMDWIVMPSAASPRLMDPETGEYFNDETVQAIEESRKGIGVVRYESFDDFAKAVRAL